MAIDTSIYGNLLARPKSAVDYQQDYAALDLAQQQKQGNALAMQSTQRKFAAEDAAAAQAGRLRNALAAAPDEESRARVFDQFGMIEDATKLRAAPVERGLKAAQAGKAQGEALDAGLGRYRKALDMVQTPQQAVEWLKAQYSDPVVGEYVGKIGGPIMAAAQRIPMDPQGFAQWRAQAAMGIEKHMQEQRQQAEFGLKANNELIRPDGTLNMPLFNAKQQIGKASASNVNVKVDAKLGEGLAKEVGPMIAGSAQGAEGALGQLQTSKQIMQAIDSGKVIAGPGASWRLNAKQWAQTLGVGSADDAEAIGNTRTVIQGMAQQIVNARKQLAGQGQVSDSEQRLLERATSGSIDELTPPEIKQLAQMNSRLSRQVIQRHNAKLDKLKADPATTGLATYFEAIPVEDDPAPSKRGAKPGAAPAAGGMPSLDMSAIEAELARRGGK